MFDRKAKDRPAYEQYNVDELPFQSDRAVFSLDLLRKVAQVRQERTRRPSPDHGVKPTSYPYPLAGITFCAHCDQQAQEHKNPKLRSRLGGKGGAITYEKLRYRHKMGVSCGAHNRSVPAEVYDRDFQRLIHLLTIKPEAADLMTELAIQADQTEGRFRNDADIEQQKQEAIALCRRRIEAAINLYGDGVIGREEYERRVAVNTQEIAHWERRTTETQ